MKRLFNRNFTLLITGQSFPVLGAAIYSVVMTLYLKLITDSAAFLGIIQMLLFLPPVVLGPLAGTLVDRTSRRTVIVVSDFLRGVCLVVLSIFTLDRFLDLKVIDLAIAQIHFSSYPFPVYAVCGATLLLGIIDSCFYSAMNVIVPEILAKDKIQKGNSLFEGVWGSLGVAGNALGGILFISIGSASVILIRGISHFSAAAAGLFLSIPQKAPPAGRTSSYGDLFKEVKEGFRFIWENKGMRNQTAIYMLMNLLFPIVMLGQVFLITDVMKLSDAFYGYLAGVITLSSMLGCLAFGFLRITEKGNYRAICGMFFIRAVVLLLLSVTTNTFLVFVLFTLLSASMAVSRLISVSLKQKVLPPELRGRIFSTENSINGALVPISFALGGLIIDLLKKDILLLFFIISVLYAILALLFASSTSIRRFYLASGPDPVQPSMVSRSITETIDP